MGEFLGITPPLDTPFRVRAIGMSHFRVLALRDLNAAIETNTAFVVHHHATPVAAVIPYATFLRIQKILTSSKDES